MHMSIQTQHDDVRIVDSFDDGGKMCRRAHEVGAVVGLALAAVLVAMGGSAAVWLAPVIVIAAIAAGHDHRSGHLPDAFVVTATVSGLVGAIAVQGVQGIAPALTGVLALSLPLLAFHLISPCSMAFGDVKFATALGGLLGLAGTDLADRVVLAMTALTVAAGLAVLGAVTVGSRWIPFGPALYLGTCATLVATVFTRSTLS